ncbi:hypothetical protein GSI_04607 [Ganoderma sinense ZZ0214-1]|uniref:Uncharacterized protein n=1 Tax=Ganoderma sinense ZZ0214-1 TaxID=1077348 RepID=A0A2G8SHG5_9APHY|nr:hypothetical protein GSI_04607 [Ganoderma sinense ZZ0214-1]
MSSRDPPSVLQRISPGTHPHIPPSCPLRTPGLRTPNLLAPRPLRLPQLRLHPPRLPLHCVHLHLPSPALLLHPCHLELELELHHICSIKARCCVRDPELRRVLPALRRVLTPEFLLELHCRLPQDSFEVARQTLKFLCEDVGQVRRCVQVVPAVTLAIFLARRDCRRCVGRTHARRIPLPLVISVPVPPLVARMFSFMVRPQLHSQKDMHHLLLLAVVLLLVVRLPVRWAPASAQSSSSRALGPARQ